MAARGVSRSHNTDSRQAHRIFLWRSRSRADLKTAIEGFRNAVAERPWGAVTVHSDRNGGCDGWDHRLAVVAEGSGDLDDKLSKAVGRLEGTGGAFAFPTGIHYCDHSRTSGKVAFMFPGQGSHRVGMVEGLTRQYPGAHAFWKTADSVLEGRLEKPLSEYVYPAVEEESAVDALTGTNVAQPAIGAADLMVHHVLTDLGIRADMSVGHSYGEYAALSAAGALSFEDLIRLSEARGRAIRHACRGGEGAMLAIGETRDAAERLVAGCEGVVVANVNGPAQTVVSGPKAEVDGLHERCAEEGVRATRLSVAAAFHSPLLRPAREPLRRILDGIPFAQTRIPVYSNTTAEPYPINPESIKNGLVDHLTTPVRFMDAILNMYRDGARVFVEVGPGSTLTGLAGGTLKGRDPVITGVDHRDGLFGLLNALARLYVAGVPWSIERLRERMAGGRADMALQPPAGAVSSERCQLRAKGGRETRLSSVEAAMKRHQVMMRLFVESQARVMVQYLRSEAPDPGPSRDGSARRLAPARIPPSTDETAESEPLDAVNADSAAGGPDGAILQELRSVVASLTGYPPDMLDPGLDLESDLGIDSIKRVEILVELEERSLAPTDTSDDERKSFSRLTTLAQMAEHLYAARVEPCRSEKADSDGASDTVSVQSADTAGRGGIYAPRPARSTIEWRDSRIVAKDRPRKGTVVIDGPDAELAEALAVALSASMTGLRAARRDESGTQEGFLKDVVGYVHLGTFPAPATTGELCDSAGAIRKDLLKMVSNLQSLGDRLRSSRGFVVGMVGATPPGGTGDSLFNPLAGAHVGALKSIAQEWPEVDCTAVEVPVGVDSGELVDILMSELGSDDGLAEVAYRDGNRRTPVLQAADVQEDHLEDQVQLNEGDVLLVTGGGRGITTEVTSALAARWRPVLVVVGRTVPTEEHERYRGISNMAELKREIAKALRESGEPASPPSIETTYQSIIRQRQLAENLRRLRDQTTEAHYMVADVGDGESLDRVVAGVYRRFGRIDGVIHGAGVIEDRLIADKDMSSFKRVLRPKVDGALALVGSLRLDELKFLCFFSSTAALLGNAGQCDYAAANETLNRLARWLNLRTPARVFSMIWGPWKPGVGMVDDLLARRFKDRGIPLIDRERGAAAFVDELCLGSKKDAEVVFG